MKWSPIATSDLGHFRMRLDYYLGSLVLTWAGFSRLSRAFGDDQRKLLRACVRKRITRRLMQSARIVFSCYASSHLKHWPKTMAHYLHIAEHWKRQWPWLMSATAHVSNRENGGKVNIDPYRHDNFRWYFAAVIYLNLCGLNNLNRLSMGQPTYTHFILVLRFAKKIRYPPFVKSVT